MRTESTTSIDGSFVASRRRPMTHPTTSPMAIPPAAVTTKSKNTPPTVRLAAPSALTATTRPSAPSRR